MISSLEIHCYKHEFESLISIHLESADIIAVVLEVALFRPKLSPVAQLIVPHELLHVGPGVP